MSVQPTGQTPASTGPGDRAGDRTSGDAGAAFGLALAQARGAAQRRTTQPVQTQARDARDVPGPRDAQDAREAQRRTQPRSQRTQDAQRPDAARRAEQHRARRASDDGATAERSERYERSDRSERSERERKSSRAGEPEAQPAGHPPVLEPQLLAVTVGAPGSGDPAADGEPPAEGVGSDIAGVSGNGTTRAGTAGSPAVPTTQVAGEPGDPVADPAAGTTPGSPSDDPLAGVLPLPEPETAAVVAPAGGTGKDGAGTDPPGTAGLVPDPSAPGAPGALPRGLLDGLTPVPDPQAPATPQTPQAGAGTPSVADLAAAGAAGGAPGGETGAGGEPDAGTPSPSAAAAVTQTGAAGQAFRAEQVEAASRTTRPGEQHSPPVTDQVTRHVLAARSLGDGTRETVLHLTPDHLGPVTVTLQVQGSDVRLDLAANDAALAALNADLGDLRDGLSASGLELTDVTLRPSDDGGQQQPGRSPGQEGLGDGRQDGRPDPNGDGRATDGRPGSRQTGGTGTAATTAGAERSPETERSGRPGPLDIRV